MTILLKAKPFLDDKTPELFERSQKVRKVGVIPTLKILLVGNDPASKIYTQNKKKFSEKVAIDCEIVTLPHDCSEEHFLATLHSFTNDPQVHGVMVQSPLPPALRHLNISLLIPPEKDVDGFHPINVGKLLLGEEKDLFIPCTPKGILTLLHYYGHSVAGKKVTIVGRGAIVGRPLSALLLNHHATVTICHSKTKDLEYHTQSADIIVTAIGKARFLEKCHLSPTKAHEQVIVDVGINALEEGGICGDVHFDEVAPYVGSITPVPGGIGPLTIFSLAENVLSAAEQSVALRQKG